MFSRKPHSFPTKLDTTMKTQPKELPINTNTLPILSLSNSRNSFAHRESGKTQKCNTFSRKPHSYPTKLDTTMKTQPKELPINTNTLPILSLSNSRNSVAHRESGKTQKCNMFSRKPHSYPTKLDTTMKTQPKELPIIDVNRNFTIPVYN